MSIPRSRSGVVKTLFAYARVRVALFFLAERKRCLLKEGRLSLFRGCRYV